MSWESKLIRTVSPKELSELQIPTKRLAPHSGGSAWRQHSGAGSTLQGTELALGDPFPRQTLDKDLLHARHPTGPRGDR